jgi:hypothetical protein
VVLAGSNVVCPGYYESGQKELARRRDLLGLCVFGASFVAFNTTLIIAAAAAG